MKNVTTKFLYYPISAIAIIIGFSLHASDIPISKYNIFEPLITLDKKEVLQNGAPYLPYATQTAGYVTSFFGMTLLCPTAVPFMVLPVGLKLGATCTGVLIGTGLLAWRVLSRCAILTKYNCDVEIRKKLLDRLLPHHPDWDAIFLSSMHANFIKPMLYTGALMSFGLFIALMNKNKVSLY